MRCPESKIQAAVLHADEEIRVHAVHYYDKMRHVDSAVMPLVIQAVETFGRQKAARLVCPARHLPQSEATIDWVIGELNDPSCDQHQDYGFHLSMVLADADPILLVPRQADILNARHFRSDVLPIFKERLEMSSWSEAECWRKLLDFCDEGKDKVSADDVDLMHAERIVEALARFGRHRESEVVERLSIEKDCYRGDVMYWLEPLLVRLAGLATMEAAIPLLVSRLRGDDDILRDECNDALVAMGSPAVLEALAFAYPKEEFDFRMNAAFLLADIHADQAAELCHRFYEQEQDKRLKFQFATALLSQFAYAGIEAARKLLFGRELDWESTGLRNDLLDSCTIMEERFPEYDQWLANRAKEQKEHQERVQQLKDDPKGLMMFALEKLAGQKATTPNAKASKAAIVSRLKSPQPTAGRTQSPKKKIGRNDSCPCGSGKKFKSCCLKKQVSY